MGTEPVSGAPYIIICSGRIGEANTNSIGSQIVAVSNAAAQLCAFMQSFYPDFQVSDLQPISTIQHQLMDFLLGETELNNQQAKEKVKALIHEMYVLEQKYQGE